MTTESNSSNTPSTPRYATPTDADNTKEAPRAPIDNARPSQIIARKTSQLPTLSKVIYHVDHYTSMSIVVMAFTMALLAMLVLGAILGFPHSWVVTFDVAVSSMTLFMVFTIQHTQSREQVATQRKLDELLRAMPGAAESLMMLEESPTEFMLEVEEVQREMRADLVQDDRTPTSER